MPHGSGFLDFQNKNISITLFKSIQNENIYSTLTNGQNSTITTLYEMPIKSTITYKY